ncbi:gastrula zinc finger protein XlCGF57.1-like isoform X8 [Aricia agestis]|uniref:gastrula zinc finger protein XlCGF57.1-like isoform X8 n=1 Tax=Aricia agestis TaxID=91739 RepID=UPI001C2085C1|nr:gastrula zinc finger protein XlCGF57.1-like isoform X8 [Aricia agestis]
MEPKTIEWRPGPAVCRCCLAEGCYKDISTEYFWMGKREVYAEMLSETLDLSIAYSTSGGPNSNSRLICEQCISKLRDATEFKRQVQECERTFIQWLDPGNSVADATATEVKLEQVKKEKNHNSDEDDDFNDQPDFGDDDGYDDLDDDVPLTKYASKTPKKEPVDLQDLLDNVKPTTKRKSTTTKDKSTAKKAKVSKEKATSSKPKPEKKKKDLQDPRQEKVKRNAEIVLKHSTLYPFRLRGESMLCVYCCENYEDPKEFRNHMDTEHTTFRLSTAFAHRPNCQEYIKVDCTNLKCRLCSCGFESVGDVAKHLHDVHNFLTLDLTHDLGVEPYKLNLNKYICVICNQKLPTITKLCRHTTSHFLKYTCDICGRSYLRCEALKYHMKCSHSGSNVCRKCWKDFATPEKKKEHISTSPACWPFCCVYCRKRFQSWEKKQDHLVAVHGRPKRTYTCPDCGEKYEKRSLFYAHYSVNHSNQYFGCPCCDLKFASKAKMEEHMRGHTGEKSFECTVCFKLFGTRKSLKQHMWIHSEQKRFVCGVCKKQFAQKVSLKSHIKSFNHNVLN